MITLLKRKQRAREFGFWFKRAAVFTLPSGIQIGTKRISLNLPDDGGTRTAFIDVLLDDCYWLRELPDDIHTVVDIGCHAGLFSLAARNRWPESVIHGYEPNAAMKNHWKYHAAQADFSVRTESVGIAAGTVAMVPNADSVQVRTVETDNGRVRQVGFREVVARLGGSVGVVKMDCEGAEWPILRDQESWKHVRFLTMEFHLWAGYTLEELRARLAKLGFRIRHVQVTGSDFGVLLAER